MYGITLHKWQKSELSERIAKQLSERALTTAGSYKRTPKGDTITLEPTSGIIVRL